MSEKKIEIGGRIHSIATGNVLAGANEIFDDDKNKKQSDINTETYTLVNDVNERLNGLSPDQQSALTVAAKATNNETKLGYYVCGTEGNVAAKVISDATGYILSKGGSMKIKMTNANTVANATLNINSTGAKPLYYDGERASAFNSWEAGETVEVYYDGTNYYANNVAGGSGSGDGAFDISAKTGQNYETLTAALTAANTILPASKKKGGMSIKFIRLTPATYSVVKTEGLTEQPTGTEVQEALAITDGTYTAAQLPVDAPANTATYWIAVTETVEDTETTTYTTWVITKVTADKTEYVQYRLMKTAWSNVVGYWQGVDSEPVAGSRNLVESGGVETYMFDINHAIGHVSKLVGNGTAISSITIQPVLDHVYQLEMLDTDWDIGGISASYSVFYLAGYNGSSYDRNIDVIRGGEQWATKKPQSRYVFRWKDNISTNGTLRLGIRAKAGVEVRYRITDITADYEGVLVGINNIGSTNIKYNNLIHNHKYCLRLKNTSWLYNNTEGSAYSAKLFVTSYDDQEAYTALFAVAKSQSLVSEYTFTVPENSAYIIIGGRANNGEFIRFQLDDITNTEYINGYYLNGNNNNYVDIRINIEYSGEYELQLKDTEWDTTGFSGEIFSLKTYDSDGTLIQNVIYKTKDNNVILQPVYRLTFSEDVKQIKIGGRRAAGEKIEWKLLPLQKSFVDDIAQRPTTEEAYNIVNDSLPSELSAFTLMNNKANVAFDHTTNKTVADSSFNKNFDYRKVKAGDHFKVYATSAAGAGNLVGVYIFDEAPVSAGIDGEVLYKYYAYRDNPLVGADIIIPRDGYMAIYLFVNSSNISSFQLVKVSDFTDIYNSNQYFEEPYTKLNIPLTVNNVIDCTEGSETFGEAVTVTDGGNNYGSSDFISLEGAEFVKIAINRTGANAYFSLLITWSCGSVFYDENKQPLVLPENTPVESRGCGYSSSYSVYSVDGVKNEGLIRVPSEAKYLRVTSHTGDGNRIAKVSIYKKKVADVVESIDNNINDSAIDIVRQAQWVKQSGVTAKALTLLHFSDIHGDTEAADKLKEEMEKYAFLIDDNLCTGDVCQQAYNSTNVVNPGSYAWTYGDAATHGYKWWTEITELAKKCLFVLGNHDGATNDTTEYDKREDSAAWDGIGKDADYNYYFAPFAEELGITQPEGVDDPDSPNYHACYWLKDYSEQKIRLIGLDCMHRYDGLLDNDGNPIDDSWVKHATTEQETWLKSVLAETLDAENPAYGYSVLFACHYPLDDCTGDNKEWDDNSHKFVYNRKSNGGRVFSYKNNAPVNFTTYDVTNFILSLKFNMRNRVADTSTIGYKKGNVNHIGDIISSWIDSGGKCIAWISGHVHNDYMLYPVKYPNIPIVAIDKTGYYTSGGSDYNNRNTDQSLLCANLYVVDTQNGYFKIIRLGVNINKQLISKKYMCYDYINKVVISEG